MKIKKKEKDYTTTESPFVKMTILLYNKCLGFSRRIE